MKTKVRLLNEKGIQTFREYLADLRAGANPPAPTHILLDATQTQEADGTATIETKDFASRMDAAAYLSEALKNLPDSVLHEPGLWSWLSLFYFEQLCPPGKDGVRKLGRTIDIS